MHLERRSSGFALAALITFALSVSCGDSESSSGGTGGASAGTGGVSSGGMSTGGVSTGGISTGGMGTGGVSTGGVSTGGASTGGAGVGGVGTGGASSGGQSSGGAGAGGGGDATGGVGTGGADTGGTGTGGGGTGSGGTSGSGGQAGGDTLPSPGCGSPAGITSGEANIDVSGKTRKYIIEVPDGYDPNHPYKLIFGWHPWGGSADQTAGMGYFGLESVSDGQAILVAPEGQDYQGNGLGWGNEGGEDIAFLHAMVDYFSDELCIDQNRIFSTGFSFGAMFSFTLACTENSMMRAIAPMAGNAFTSGGCEDSSRSVATLAFIGTDDSLLDGHRSAVQLFVERNGCSAQTQPVQPSWCDGLDAQYQPCTCVEYQGCNPGYPVIECEYTGGHMFAPDSGATLWEFFSQF